MCLRVSRGFTAGGRRLAGAQAPLAQQLPVRPGPRPGWGAQLTLPGELKPQPPALARARPQGGEGEAPGGPPQWMGRKKENESRAGEGGDSGAGREEKGQGAEQSLGTGSGGWEGQGLDHLRRSFSPGGAGGRRGASSHSSRRCQGLSTASSCSFDLASFCPPWGVLPGPHAIQPG